MIRNLYRLLEAEERASVENAFHADWRRMNVVELDRYTCERAAPCFVTYDVRQGQAALLLGFTVLGN